MFDRRWRPAIEKSLGPAGAVIRRFGVSADQLTICGLVMAGAAAVAVGAGELELGLLLLAMAAVPDLLDGAVAKASGSDGPRGAFFDSVADRVADALILGGIAWYLAGAHEGRIALLPMAVLASSMLISYERARAESLGFEARGGLMERAERLIALGIGLLLEPLLIPVLWLMLALTLLTAVQRFVKVWRQAGGPPRPMPATSRWRARRTARPTARAWRRRSIAGRR